MAVTKLNNLVNPQVVADTLTAQLPSAIKFSAICEVNKDLVGTPGNTISVPKYAYIGDAVDVAEGGEITATTLTATSTQATVKKAGKGVTITDEAALSGCLLEYDSGFLYQKTGYILSHFAAAMGLSKSFFDMCRTHIPKGKAYLHNNGHDFIWHENWKLYAPADIMQLINKGVTDYDAI